VAAFARICPSANATSCLNNASACKDEEESAAKASINAWTAAWFVSSERNVNNARNRSWIGNDWSMSVFESDAMFCISVLFVLIYTRASHTAEEMKKNVRFSHLT
jgi:hypothetical protein